MNLKQLFHATLSYMNTVGRQVPDFTPGA